MIFHIDFFIYPSRVSPWSEKSAINQPGQAPKIPGAPHQMGPVCPKWIRPLGALKAAAVQLGEESGLGNGGKRNKHIGGWPLASKVNHGISPATCGIYEGNIGNFNHRFMWDCLYIEMVMSQKPILIFRNPRQIASNNSEVSICFNHQHWDLNGKMMKHGFIRINHGELCKI